MIVYINQNRLAPAEPDPSPMPAGMDDTGTGVWIGRIEAAARLGVRETTLDRMARDGMVERVYRRVRGQAEPLFFFEQIERLLAARPAVLPSLERQPAQQDIPSPPHTGNHAAEQTAPLLSQRRPPKVHRRRDATKLDRT